MMGLLEEVLMRVLGRHLLGLHNHANILHDLLRQMLILEIVGGQDGQQVLMQ